MKNEKLIPHEIECEVIETYEPPPAETQYAPYGGVHTPIGNLHCLVIFVGFQDSNISGIPSWAKGPDNDIFNSNVNNIGNKLNISNFYKKMSNQNAPFLITGDVFPELVIVPFDENYNNAGIINNAVFNYISTNYPNFNWGKYDNRENNPDFLYDNSTSEPDNKIDYVVLIYRRGNGFSGVSGITGRPFSVTTNYSGTTDTFYIRHGFTALESRNNASSFRNFFYHEFGHNLYNAPHTFGANAVVGRNFYTTYGWGMMNSSTNSLHSANSWERWFLGWIELTTNGVNSDIKTANDLPANGEFILRDFITTGDAIRIKIPNSEGQYLWLENRTGATVFDNRDGWVNNGCTPPMPLPPPPRGLLMFVENITDSRNITNITSSGANSLRLIHSGGNWDYSRSEEPINPCQWWGNKVYNFSKTTPNPLSGYNNHVFVRDDYYRFINESTPPDYTSLDNIIELDEFWNSPNQYRKEFHDVIKENNVYVYGPLLSNIAFNEGQKIGMGTNPPITGIQTYNATTHQNTPINLHGLSVEVLNYYSNGNVRVKVRFNEYNVKNDVRWTGNIVNKEKVVLNEGKTIELAQNYTPNQIFRDPTSGVFAKPTVFTCEDGSEFVLQENSNLVLKDKSTLRLKSGSIMEIENNASLTIEAGSILVIEPCARLIIRDYGKIVAEAGAVFTISEGAVIATDKGYVVNIPYIEEMDNWNNWVIAPRAY